MSANPDLMQLLATGPTANLYFDFSDTRAFWINGTTQPIILGRGFSSGFSTGFGSGSVLPGQTGFFMVSAEQACAWIQSGQASNIYFNPFGLTPPTRYSNVVG